MALRAFRSNPSLGGFGGESSNFERLDEKQHTSEINNNGGGNTIIRKKKLSNTDLGTQTETKETKYDDDSVIGGIGSDDDAFAQIVKELVDNAVDACSSSLLENKDDSEQDFLPKRVKVVLEPIDHKPKNNQNDNYDDQDTMKEYLRVTVTDNGIGMENISQCVCAFSTSKGSNERNKESSVQKKETDSSQKHAESMHQNQDLTAGRYGIGLTLCLLHAQRLVPNSFASITSASAQSTHWVRSRYVVDTQKDAVICVKEESLPKKRSNESGTAVSLLVPVRRK